MSTLDITDLLTGDTRRLTDFNGLSRERGVNGEKLISLNVFDTEKNNKSFSYVLEENSITFDGEDYVIKEVSKTPIGNTFYKEVVCIHKFFCDMREQRIYEAYTQSFTFNNVLNTIFANTGYTYEITGNFYAESFENFGDGKDKLDLFNQVLGRYSAEFEISGTVIKLSKQKGSATPTFKLLYNHNIKTIDYNQNTNNLSTYIKGYGDLDEETGEYLLTAEYTSPNASLFPANTPDGLRHAPPIKDGKYKILANLEQALEEALIDVPEVSITISFADMRKYGYPYQVPNDGDYLYCIHEPFGLDLTIRIIKIVEHFNRNLEPIDTNVTLGNPRESITDQFNSTEKRLGQILDPNGRVNESYLPDAIRRAKDAMVSAQTELEFNNGIIARSKTNPNDVVIYNSGGFFISKDGGATPVSALTADGFVASAGVVGQFDADNVRVGMNTGSDIPALEFNSNGLRANTGTTGKYTELNGSGIYVKNGAAIIERADGYALMIDGYQQFDFAVEAHEPPFTSTLVTIEGEWWKTSSVDDTNLQFYTLKKTGRYLKVWVGHGMGSTAGGTSGRVSVVQSGSFTVLGSKLFSNQKDQSSVNESTITIDLGVPDGNLISFYLRLNTGNASYPAYARKKRIWIEG